MKLQSYTADKEKKVLLSDELLRLVTPAPVKKTGSRAFSAFLVALLYICFLSALAVVYMLGMSLISAASAFYTLLPISCATLLLLFRVLKQKQ